MERNELRYRIISALLQADGPLTLREIEAACRPAQGSLDRASLVDALAELVAAAQVVQGSLGRPESAVPGGAESRYAWRARWEREAQSSTNELQQDLRSTLEAAERIPPGELDLQSRPSTAFYNYVVGPGYHPPDNKRLLVFVQCSVRRPFSSAPSHAPLRRAIRAATGYDPRQDPACPVHVVVLASKIGPVPSDGFHPHELEDLYPANVRGGGVKHLSTETFERVKPVLGQRMAHYLLAYGQQYERITSFAEGRYAEVMEHARELAVQQCGPGLRSDCFSRLVILPRKDGPAITRMNQSRPHQYWARYWIQLYLEIESWLDPEEQQQARARLQRLKVEYRA